jgi:hypothetical protein
MKGTAVEMERQGRHYKLKNMKMVTVEREEDEVREDGGRREGGRGSSHLLCDILKLIDQHKKKKGDAGVGGEGG